MGLPHPVGGILHNSVFPRGRCRIVTDLNMLFTFVLLFFSGIVRLRPVGSGAYDKRWFGIYSSKILGTFQRADRR